MIAFEGDEVQCVVFAFDCVNKIVEIRFGRGTFVRLQLTRNSTKDKYFRFDSFRFETKRTSLLDVAGAAPFFARRDAEPARSTTSDRE